MTTKKARFSYLIPLLPALGLALLLSLPAPALEQASYTMEILVDGVPLTEYRENGTTYIEALEGREYSIRLSNRSAGRIAVALSVDGLNTIDAKVTTAEQASKWILAPYQTIILEGWQVSSSTARRFFFTTEEQSYGAWLGRAANLGLISAAVFREVDPIPAPIYRGGGDSRRLDAPGAAGAPASPEPSGRRDRIEMESRQKAESRGTAQPQAVDEFAATGIGRGLDHSVQRLAFRAEQHPAAKMQVRYEYSDALVRLGILERHHAAQDDPLLRRERARGFEDSSFAPDPYRQAR